RGDHGIAGTDEHADEIAEKTVDPLAHDDMFRPDPVMGGKRVAQVVVFGVAVHPDVTRGPRHRLDRRGRGAEDILGGAETGGEGAAAPALLGLGPDEGHGGGQAGDEGGVAGSGHGGLWSGCRAGGAAPGPPGYFGQDEGVSRYPPASSARISAWPPRPLRGPAFRGFPRRSPRARFRRTWGCSDGP